MNVYVPKNLAPKETAAPCLDCTDRVVGCHAECDTYKQWRKKHLQAAKERKQMLDEERIAADVLIKGAMKQGKIKPKQR